MQGRRMCKKLLMMLMCICVLIAGCSKKPLNSMTIGQVRKLVLDWTYGKLPEQQVEGADEIRKELEVLDKELVEREAELGRRLHLLFEQAKEYKEKNVSISRQERKELHKHLTPDFPQEEYDKLEKEYRDRGALRFKRERELWQAHKKGESVHSQECSKLRSEFRGKLTPLREQLEPDKSVKTFYKVFGKPKDKSLIGDNYYFQYRCKDGLVVLEIPAPLFDDNDKVWISDVSVL